jgi:hypothetical protein
LFVSSLFLLLCVRLEAFALLPVLILLFFAVKKAQKRHLVEKNEIPTLVVAGFLVTFRALVSLSVLGEKWCCAEGLPLEAFHPIYFIRNILPNISNLFTKPEFPFIITVAALIAISHMKNLTIAALALWIIAYFLLYSTYYAGMLFSPEFSGSYGRYLLIMIPPFLLLAATTLDSWIRSFRNREKGAVLIWLIVGLICIFALYPMLRSYKTLITISPHYELVELGPEQIHMGVSDFIVPQLPQDAILLSNIVTPLVMSGKSGALFGSFLTDTTVRDLIVGQLRKGTRVFSIAPFQCVEYPAQCEKIANFVDFEPVKTNPGDLIFAEVKLR